MRLFTENSKLEYNFSAGGSQIGIYATVLTSMRSIMPKSREDRLEVLIISLQLARSDHLLIVHQNNALVLLIICRLWKIVTC
jgi:hypothetical protein